VTAAVHAATSLRVAVAPSAPASTPVSHAAALPPGAIALPPATAAKADVLDVGDAAAVFVLSMDRVVFAADPLGPARGYRHAFLEAGLVGERIYLDAVPRGLGACAVGAFYDDEASTVVGVDPAREWVIHFAAPGVPSD
jgi:nitroreductase